MAVVFLAAASLAADETYTIKFKDGAKGDVRTVKEESTEQATVKAVDAAGNALLDKAEKKVTTAAYKETILEQPEGAKQPTRVKREYEKAQVKADDKAVDLPYSGKTVLIEKKGDKYVFQIEGGDELTGKDAEPLNKEFNKKAVEEEDLKLLLPAKPVKVGDTWKLDAAALTKFIASDDAMTLDTTKAGGTGKLVKVYQQDGKQFGVITLTLDLSIKELKLGPAKQAVKAGSKMTMQIDLDACIDGSVATGTMKATADMDIAADIKQGDTVLGKLTVKGQSGGTKTQTELPKK
jgi:hypothetical protein